MSDMHLDAPIRFESYVRPMVWGGRGLETLGKRLASPEPCGEAWDLSDHPHHHSVVAEGPAQGKTLRWLMENHATELLGGAAERHKQFPWLVKFLDACDWLSVQVHPDEVSVRHLWPGEGSKTEAWFVLAAQPGSRIYAGLKPGVDANRFRAAIDAGTTPDCLHSFEPRPGDCVFLPAGTVHAVGGGVVMAEVQQTSDATFRIFDWNRRDAQGKSRTLHIEQAMACIDWTRGPVEPIHVDLGGPSRPLVRCPYFQLDYFQTAQPTECSGHGNVQVMIVLSGEGELGGAEFHRGDVWLLPASMPRTKCRPRVPLTALWCTLV